MPHIIELNYDDIVNWRRLGIVIFLQTFSPKRTPIERLVLKNLAMVRSGNLCAYIQTARSFSCLRLPLCLVGTNWQPPFLPTEGVP